MRRVRDQIFGTLKTILTSRKSDQKKLEHLFYSIEAKFKMIGYCVAYIKTFYEEYPEFKVISLKFKNKEEEIVVDCTCGHYNLDNLKCLFYTLVNVCVSLIDSMEELVYFIYENEITAQTKKINYGKKIDERTFNFKKLNELFDRKTMLDDTIYKLIEDNSDFKNIIDLRNTMTHSNITNVMKADSYSGNRLEICNKWTPLGNDMLIQEYSTYIFDVSQKTIITIMQCIKDAPDSCLILQDT